LAKSKGQPVPSLPVPTSVEITVATEFVGWQRSVLDLLRSEYEKSEKKILPDIRTIAPVVQNLPSIKANKKITSDCHEICC